MRPTPAAEGSTTGKQMTTTVLVDLRITVNKMVDTRMQGGENLRREDVVRLAKACVQDRTGRTPDSGSGTRSSGT